MRRMTTFASDASDGRTTPILPSIEKDRIEMLLSEDPNENPVSGCVRNLSMQPFETK